MGDISEKEKIYSFPTSLPTTISKQEIIAKRRAGEITVEFDSPDEMEQEPVIVPSKQVENVSPNVNQQTKSKPSANANPLKRKRPTVAAQKKPNITTTSVKR